MAQSNFMLKHHEPTLEDEQYEQQLAYDDDDSDEPDFDPDSEDEGIEDYKIGGYHPVHIGQVIFNRYVIIQKLGWGHFSTVWLAKDMKYDNYVAIKIQKSAPNYLQASYDQVEILQKVQRTMKTPEWLDNLKKYYPQKVNFGRDDTPVVGLLNCFIHKGPYGNHFCFIFEILGVNLYEIIKRYNFKGIPMDICQKIAKEVLVGLDFLHRFCGVIHTDLKPENILVCLSQEQKRQIIENGFLKQSQAYRERVKDYQKAHGIKVEDPEEKKKEKQVELVHEKIKALKEKYQLLEEQYKIKCPTLNKTQRKNAKKHINKQKTKIEQAENELKAMMPEPQKQKNSGGLSMLQLDPPKKPKNLRGPKLTNNVRVKIADLGNACWIHHHFAKTIQTRQYRSPETLLGVQYNTNADIWSFACMMYELLTGHLLFEPTKGIGISKNEHHLALMQQRVGLFPTNFKMSSSKFKHYFKAGGKLKNFQKIPKLSIKSLLCGKFEITEQESKYFQQFMQPMLRHDPAERISARQALKSPWLLRQTKTYKMSPQEYMEYMQNLDGQTRRDDGYIVKIQQNMQHNPQEFDADVGQHLPHQPPQLHQRTPININLIDRSFTDLGYVGYCDGLRLEQLDGEANWQFRTS